MNYLICAAREKLHSSGQLILGSLICSLGFFKTSTDSNSSSKNRWTKNNGTLSNIPGIIEIKKVIPAECFKASLKRSLLHLLFDLGMVSFLYLLIRCLECEYLSAIWPVALPFYWIFQGTMFWALFVIGHDCGHDSFSNNSLINDVFGTLVHATILVPFYPWKLSHRHHHKNTGNIDRDEVFYPIRTSLATEAFRFKPIAPGFGLGVSWIMYLFVGYFPRGVCHWNPLERMFAGHVIGCCLSILATFLWLMVLVVYAQCCGIMAVIVHYVIPWFVFASWLVIVTFLHHTESDVPWYADTNWSNVKGQLSTVDRDYGWAHQLTHNIGTHQVHHLFTKIPHYNLEVATAAFRRNFPHLVRISSEPIIPAFIRMFRTFNQQHCIPDDAPIHVYS